MVIGVTVTVPVDMEKSEMSLSMSSSGNRTAVSSVEAFIESGMRFDRDTSVATIEASVVGGGTKVVAPVVVMIAVSFTETGSISLSG